MGRDGVIREENYGQDRLLERLYTSFYGRILLKVLTQPGLSRAAGIFLDRKASCFLIRPFIEKNQMDMRLFEVAIFICIFIVDDIDPMLNFIVVVKAFFKLLFPVIRISRQIFDLLHNFTYAQIHLLLSLPCLPHIYHII